jgi:broad specificity phosphatase PhoE
MRSTFVAVIILIRHGQTTTNAQGLLVGRSDPHLTQLGERQAQALGPYLENVDEVWTSPLLRARETAALALAGRESIVKDSFIELDYGELDGQPLSAITPGDWRAFEAEHDLVFGGGESLSQVDERVHKELDALLNDESSLLHSRDRHLVIVTHLSPIKSAMIWALGVPGSATWRTRLDNGSMTTISVRGETPQLIHFNFVPTLG